MTGRGAWTDRRFLLDVQYRDAGNLAARQAIYAFRRPRVDLWGWALDLAELSGDETVVDVGCGNGRYLAALRGRGHRGLVAGVDLAPGMLREVLAGAPAQPLLRADAARLPLAGAGADVALAMHMLYHVPVPRQAVAELRRVVRPGGRALVLLNTTDHLAELRGLLREAGAAAGMRLAGGTAEAVRFEDGRAIVAEAFGEVEPHLMGGELVVPDPAPVLAYVASMNPLLAAGDGAPAVLAEVERRVADRIATEGAFRVRTGVGCFVCR